MKPDSIGLAVIACPSTFQSLAVQAPEVNRKPGFYFIALNRFTFNTLRDLSTLIVQRICIRSMNLRSKQPQLARLLGRRYLPREYFLGCGLENKHC